MADQIGISIDPAELTLVVAQVLAAPTVRLGDWQIKPLSGGLDSANRVYQLSGHAHAASGEQPWSVVLKTQQLIPDSNADPRAARYWKREVAFYQSGLIDDLFCTLVPPRCYLVSEHADVIWVWMEAVNDAVPRPWPLERYPEAARCIGCFNGTFLTDRPLPDEPWLSRHGLRSYAEQAIPLLQDLPELRKLPFFQKAYASMSDEFFLSAWARRGEFFAALDRLPQTFCHHDTIDGNLLWRSSEPGQNQIVGLDWGYAGTGALGEDLSPLAYWQISGLHPLNEKLGFFQQCLEGYLHGLADAGYLANPQQVRFASLTAIFYRYLYGGALGEFWVAGRHEANLPIIASLFGFPTIDPLLANLASDVPFFQAIYREIDALLPQMP